MNRLRGARVAVFGIGGVGGYAAEALARSGVGAIDLIDHDKVSLSNLNRQIIATLDTVGQYKVDVMRDRILSVNPNAVVNVHKCFYLPETSEQFDFSKYSYVVDAVDTVTAKLAIILRAQSMSVPVISSMGAGNKLDPTKFQVTDIYKTSVCPLAKVMRHELRKRGVKHLRVVCSTEPPVRPAAKEAGPETDQGGERETGSCRRSVPGSIAFVPSVAGLILAGEVIREIAEGC